jgi:hypothetical protein
MTSLSAVQTAAITAAEAIAAAAAVDVAAEAAATALAAVHVAAAAAVKAAARASYVAAQAAVAAIAADSHAPLADDEAARAAAKVAATVVAVANAAATAVIEAATLIGDQLERDVAAAATAVAHATSSEIDLVGEESRRVADVRLTVAQVEVLRQLGCEFGQGYYFSRPIDEATLIEWLGKRVPVGTRSHRPPPILSPETARILVMCRSGTSAHTVAAALNADNSRTTRGRRWSAAAVEDVVRMAAPARHRPEA